MNINTEVLQSLSKKLSAGEHVKPQTNDEKACFELINDLDAIVHKVEGSVSSKKHMRNEIWSTIAYTGAPTWFVTFAPADLKHPICLYYADKKLEFNPDIFRKSDEKYALIAHNPVAGARFFHMMVQLFIKHVLGVESDHEGIYGNTETYYGTVEQQGRLTLHLHLMLWIKNSMSPQQIRDKIMRSDSEFQKSLIDYLEACHIGQFQTGTLEEVRESMNKKAEDPNYVDPTNTLPSAPPEKCDKQCKQCSMCIANRIWWEKFPNIVDEIMLKSNVHKCGAKCMNNRFKTCRARFPREIVDKTEGDKNDGSIKMKKHEQWINFITPILTYLLKCNSDVSSLLSGTAIKAIVAYVTDYITKVPLKTHTMFDAIRCVFDRKAELLNSNKSREEKSRKLITNIVNSLTANMEIGGPMASLYLLGNPDHYTNYRFRPFYWRPYVNFNWKAHNYTTEKTRDEDEDEDNVLLLKMKSEYVGYSPILDYIHRPTNYYDICLYDWMRRFNKTKIYKRKSKITDDDELNDYNLDNSEESLDEYSTKLNITENNIEYNNSLSEDELDIINNCTDDDICKIEKVSKKDKINKRFHFLSEHPQYNTHTVKLLSEEKSLIPNFVSPIPRSDAGDREYYCASMMTLFKPWRSADDLKSINKTWDETFFNYKFTERQTELMNNFNIRYECHDAKDDFRLQRNKKSLAKDIPPWMSDKFVKESDEDGEIQQELNDYMTYPDDHGLNNDADELAVTGKDTLCRQMQMTQMQRILRSAGWMENSIDGYENISFDNNIEHKISYKTSNAWQTLLANKRKEILKDRLKQLSDVPSKHIFNSIINNNVDEVKFVGEEYLLQSTTLKSQEDLDRISTIIKQFTLNEEQERAFKIVAQHACLPQSEQLKMYLGGMSGTGKSQVIKALMHFFRERNESHRFIVLAPTGSAAVLVDGSTYHSVLGIFEVEKDIRKTTAQIKDRLEGVEYIFVDEVLMISCKDIYTISKQLALTLDNTQAPFGGMNIIFAGDFAQLPPVMSKSLYAHDVGTSANSGMSNYEQECAIGKALWHQITTVVILKQNMRQKSQTPQDASFRTVLENMRYKSCTNEDIEFLRTLIANNGTSLSQKKFAHVPIITSFNSYRDAINAEGARLFATRYNRELHSFYSLDLIASKSIIKPKGSKKQKLPAQYLNQKCQETVWNTPPSSSEHVAGRLDLCKDMPVMIKKNIATECCVTNGASAIVYDWTSSVMPDGKEVLETLFVQLVDPPRTIQLPGLPENVIPLSKSKHTIYYQLPSDKSIHIVRQQVDVLLNFAMTVHASQGRTRAYNVCDISNCKNHLGCYTALSRSSSADDTVILQGFDAKKIQGGIQGSLRQEFRELEILNEITKLKYFNKLTKNIYGNLRSVLICKYYENKKLSDLPEGISKHIAWNKNELLELPKINSDAKWKIIKKDSNNNNSIDKSDINNNIDFKKFKKEVNEAQKIVKQIFISTSNTEKKTTEIQSKRKHQDSDDKSKESIKANKQLRISCPNNNLVLAKPINLKWSQNSCAYDVVILSLYQIWFENFELWSKQFSERFKDLYFLSNSFKSVQQKTLSFEYVRYKWRQRLSKKQPHLFTMNSYTDILELLQYTFLLEQTAITKISTCTNCLKSVENISINSSWYGSHMYPWHNYLKYIKHKKNKPSMQSFVDFSCKISSTRLKCCSNQFSTKTLFHNCPDIMCFLLPDFKNKSSLPNFQFSKKIVIYDEKNVINKLYLKSIIYFGSSHFTSRIIDRNNDVWYFDGLNSNGESSKEQHLELFTSDQLISCKERFASCIIYAKHY